MQKVTSTPEQVAFNAAPKPKFGHYDVSWSGVRHPAGGNIFSRVAHAALEIFKNFAKYVFNAIVCIPNKLHSVLFASKQAPVVAADDVHVQHDSVDLNVYDESQQADQAEAASELPGSDRVFAEDEIDEPSEELNEWVQPALIGAGVVAATVAGMYVAGRYDLTMFGYSLPGAEAVQTIFEETIPGAASSVTGSVTGAISKAVCYVTGYQCLPSYT